MPATTIELDTPDGALPVYDVEPESDARAAVIVVQEAFGVNGHIEDIARRFAAEGYRAVAPQLYHRECVNVLGYDDFGLVTPHLLALTAKAIGADLDATLRHLAGLGFDLPSIGVVGFCMGGSIALAEAAGRPFGAAVTFYGGGVLQGRFGYPPLAELAPQLRSPWLGLFGDLDQSIPPEQVEVLRSEAARAAVPTAVVRYPDAGHAFHCDARPDTYHETSAKDAWSRMLDWFARYLQPRL